MQKFFRAKFIGSTALLPDNVQKLSYTILDTNIYSSKYWCGARNYKEEFLTCYKIQNRLLFGTEYIQKDTARLFLKQGYIFNDINEYNAFVVSKYKIINAYHDTLQILFADSTAFTNFYNEKTHEMIFQLKTIK